MEGISKKDVGKGLRDECFKPTVPSENKAYSRGGNNYVPSVIGHRTEPQGGR